ncbi:shikimate kinase [Candidatus Peregrinibacteria bacterium]|nr:shikimate kinase [Candidatus Peregrinibacteria bacterium]
MNIVLIGLRGSGKTKIGRILAEKLGWIFFDIDKEIEKQEKNTITGIVKFHSWKYFRELEKNITKKTAALDKTVISTGGGTILYPENEKILKKNSTIIYLHRTPDNCAKWLKKDQKRPPLTGAKTLEEEMQTLYIQRHHIYEKNANLIFNRTEDANKDAKKIIKLLSST